MDDIFCVWSGTNRILEQFVNHINSINPNINFTLEIGNNSINFLDLSITIANNKLEYGIFRKSTSTYTLIHATSHQSYNIKMAPFHSLIHRLINIPLTPSKFNTELNSIKFLAIKNGYSANLIDGILRKKTNNFILSKFYSSNVPTTANTWCYINFVDQSSVRISRVLAQIGIRSACTNKRNLGTLLRNNKPKLSIEHKSGVYKINCKDCDSFYIGQSGRNLGTRLAEHIKYVKNGMNCNGLSEHCIYNNHSIDSGSLRLLHSTYKSRKLNLLEQIEIQKASINKQPIVNEQTSFGLDSNPLFSKLFTSAISTHL